jgi:hypothetical protein
MAKSTIVDDLFALSAKPPWKPSITLATGFVLALHQLSVIGQPVATGLQDLFKAVFTSGASALGLIDQYVVSAALLFGAAAGFMQRRRRVDLLTQTRALAKGLPTLA